MAPAPAALAPEPEEGAAQPEASELAAPAPATAASAPDAACQLDAGNDAEGNRVAIGDTVVLTVAKNKETYNGRKAEVVGILTKQYKLLMLEGPSAGSDVKFPFGHCTLLEKKKHQLPRRQIRQPRRPARR